MLALDATSARVSPAVVFLTVGGLYVAQSVIGGLTMLGLPTVLRNLGLPSIRSAPSISPCCRGR